MNNLKNKIIISTRPLSANDSIKDCLTERGALILDFPMIKIYPVELTGNIKTILQEVATYQWIVYTSKNGVDCFFKLLNSLNNTPKELFLPKIAVVGKKTAEEVLKNNCTPCLISSGNTSADLLRELAKEIKPTDKVLLALGDLAEDTLRKGLFDSGIITRINVYRTLQEEPVSKEVIERIKQNNYDIILFTSPSGFRHFNRIMNENSISGDLRTACIGQTTEKAMVQNNFHPVLVSPKSDGETFAKELELFFNNYKN